MSRDMSYQDACDAGYDGPSPFEEARMRNRISRNNALDHRDPDYDDEMPESIDEWLNGRDEEE